VERPIVLVEINTTRRKNVVPDLLVLLVNLGDKENLERREKQVQPVTLDPLATQGQLACRVTPDQPAPLVCREISAQPDPLEIPDQLAPLEIPDQLAPQACRETPDQPEILAQLAQLVLLDRLVRMELPVTLEQLVTLDPLAKQDLPDR
jgi:hypothetical protein